jgi:hypothetical protein
MLKFAVFLQVIRIIPKKRENQEKSIIFVGVNKITRKGYD